jgi:hypothetical protein
MRQRGSLSGFTRPADISGNRLLNHGFGASILARFDRDVLASPGVTHLVLLGGMNDSRTVRALR